MTYRSILCKTFIFQQKERGKKLPALRSPFFLKHIDGFLDVAKLVHWAQIQCLPGQNQILASGQENARNWGRISCHRQSCVTLFALARCPFIYMNLQPFFTVRGHPLESLFQKEICLNFDENCCVTSL